MTNRAIFNRNYTEFTAGTTPVWLVNGGSASSATGPITASFLAGETLVQGECVYVSGQYCYPANAASSASPADYQAVGFTAQAAPLPGNSVPVNLDGVVSISDANIVAETQLVAGEYYYLSSSPGQIVQYSTASGAITAANGYAAVVNVGIAVSATELSVEIQPPVEIYN